MKHFRRIVYPIECSNYSIRTLIALFPALLLILCFLVNCAGEPWLDNDVVYFCPDCRGKYYVDMVGECERCNGMTASCAFKYCYDCAKELNCCQMCGVER